MILRACVNPPINMRMRNRCPRSLTQLSPTPFSLKTNYRQSSLSSVMPLPRSLPQSAKGGERRNSAARLLGQRYQVERRIGSGAFGAAFLVTDLKSGNERSAPHSVTRPLTGRPKLLRCVGRC